jgi:endonuclease YncB( thermonuclease family)
MMMSASQQNDVLCHIIRTLVAARHVFNKCLAAEKQQAWAAEASQRLQQLEEARP